MAKNSCILHLHVLQNGQKCPKFIKNVSKMYQNVQIPGVKSVTLIKILIDCSTEAFNKSYMCLLIDAYKQPSNVCLINLQTYIYRRTKNPNEYLVKILINLCNRWIFVQIFKEWSYPYIKIVVKIIQKWCLLYNICLNPYEIGHQKLKCVSIV